MRRMLMEVKRGRKVKGIIRKEVEEVEGILIKKDNRGREAENYRSICQWRYRRET